MHNQLFGFLFLMWILIILGGGIAVTILGPIEITGFGELNSLLSSIVKAIVAIGLSILWILILTKLKNFIFKRTFNY